MTCDDGSTAAPSSAMLRASILRTLFGALFIESLLFATIGVAGAAESQPMPPVVNSRQTGPAPPCASVSGCDRRAYDYSGTRGRMGLGASPFHPEGPGNAPD